MRNWQRIALRAKFNKHITLFQCLGMIFCIKTVRNPFRFKWLFIPIQYNAFCPRVEYKLLTLMVYGYRHQNMPIPLNYWYGIGKNMIVFCLCDCKIEDKDSKKQPNLKAEGADYFRSKELHDGKTQ